MIELQYFLKFCPIVDSSTIPYGYSKLELNKLQLILKEGQYFVVKVHSSYRVSHSKD